MENYRYITIITNICCTVALQWDGFFKFKINLQHCQPMWMACPLYTTEHFRYAKKEAYFPRKLIYYYNIKHVYFNLDLLEACPVIGPHLQETTNYHAQPDATPVTKQDVQNDLIPPAFSKIRQKVHEEELQNTAKRFWVRNSTEFIQIHFLSIH